MPNAAKKSSANKAEAVRIVPPAVVLYWKSVSSPVGTLKLLANSVALTAILWENEVLPPLVKGTPETPNHPVLREADKQLQEYFAGKRQTFSVNLDFHGTEFQKCVWQELLRIPYGKTETYAHIAQKVGRPRAVRATGGTIGKNPLPIIAPCHRVIGSNGKLTGFAGGLKIKKILLHLESV